MGVKGLNLFISRFETSVIERIDIYREIKQWKLNNEDKTPVILIDLKELAYLIQREEIGAILGGRFDYYNHLLTQLLKNLSNSSAKLVFFMPGKRYTDDLPFFIPKTEFTYSLGIEMLDKMENGQTLKSLTERTAHECSARNTLTFAYNLKRMARRYGDLIVTYQEHNQEIARYAKNHDQVLAVITNDTDFMAFEGDFEFWLASDINVRYMTCTRYCKNKLYAKLGFDHGAYQMQLLASLCGSNYLPIFIITNFLKRVTEQNSNDNPLVRGKILNVAAYVRRQPYELIDNKPKYDLKQISQDIFGDGFTEFELNSVANGLACYQLDFDEEKINSGYREHAGRNAFLQFCKTHCSFAYKMATDEIILVKDLTFVDYRNYKSKSYAELVKPILMKICGILFVHDPDRPTVRQICMKHAHDEPSKLTEETVIYPSMPLPALFDLIFKNNERIFDQHRWPLLEWVLELEGGFVEKIKKIERIDNLAAVITTLEYLVRQNELTTKEANAIFYTEHEIRNLGAIHVIYPQHADAHYVRIAHLYVKFYVLISNCLELCGLREMTNLIRFDGPLFHKNMMYLKTASDEEIGLFVSTIHPIWKFS